MDDSQIRHCVVAPRPLFDCDHPRVRSNEPGTDDGRGGGEPTRSRSAEWRTWEPRGVNLQDIGRERLVVEQPG